VLLANTQALQRTKQPSAAGTHTCDPDALLEILTKASTQRLSALNAMQDPTLSVTHAMLTLPFAAAARAACASAASPPSLSTVSSRSSARVSLIFSGAPPRDLRVHTFLSAPPSNQAYVCEPNPSDFRLQMACSMRSAFTGATRWQLPAQRQKQLFRMKASQYSTCERSPAAQEALCHPRHHVCPSLAGSAGAAVRPPAPARQSAS